LTQKISITLLNECIENNIKPNFISPNTGNILRVLSPILDAEFWSCHTYEQTTMFVLILNAFS